MPLTREEAQVLRAILDFKLGQPRRDIWVNARAIAPSLGLSEDTVGRTLRLLQMQNLVELESQMYGSTKDPVLQRYGLTPAGAEEAKYFEPMRFDFIQTRSDVLVHLFHEHSRGELPYITPEMLLTVFPIALDEMRRVLKSLEAEALVKMALFTGDDVYEMTPKGFEVASYIYRTGQFPNTFGGATTYNTTIGGNVGVANIGNSAPVTVNYTAGMSGEAFVHALQAFKEALQSHPDPDEREAGTLYTEQLRRAVEQGATGETQFQRLADWLTRQGQAMTSSAVLWNAGAALGQTLGFPFPSAPNGLGQ